MAASAVVATRSFLRRRGGVIVAAPIATASRHQDGCIQRHCGGVVHGMPLAARAPQLLAFQRRGLAAATVGPPTQAAAMIQSAYPEGSMAQSILERCQEAAVSRGVDVAATYEPWLPVDLMQTMILDFHEAVGCSWAAAIVGTCLGIRLILLPLSVLALRGNREKALLQPRFNELIEKQKTLNLEGNQEKVQEVTKELQAFTQKHGRFFMLKGVWNVIFLQVPLYITAFAAMRGLASHPDMFRGFAMESPLWLDSLALADPYALLPLMTGAMMLTNIEIFGAPDAELASMQQQVSSQFGERNTEDNPFLKYHKYILRGSMILFVPLTWSFPSGVFIFMSTNFVSTMLQNQVLKLPAIERLLELPPTPEAVAEAARAAKLADSGPPGLLALGTTLGGARGNHAVNGLRLNVVDGNSNNSGSAYRNGGGHVQQQQSQQLQQLQQGLLGTSTDAILGERNSRNTHGQVQFKRVGDLQVSSRFEVKRDVRHSAG